MNTCIRREIMRFSALACLLCAFGLASHASALITATGTGTLSCSKWLKAREDNDEAQTNLFVQWIAGFAVAHNYYVSPENKQLNVDLDDIKYFADKYCHDNPLTPAMVSVAAEYVQSIGGTIAHHNRSKKK